MYKYNQTQNSISSMHTTEPKYPTDYLNFINKHKNPNKVLNLNLLNYFNKEPILKFYTVSDNNQKFKKEELKTLLYNIKTLYESTFNEELHEFSK